MNGKPVWQARPVKTGQLPRLTRSNHCSKGIKHVLGINSAVVRQCLARQTDHAASAGQPPNQPPVNHRHTSKPDDDGSNSGHRENQLLKGFVLGALGFLGVAFAAEGITFYRFLTRQTPNTSTHEQAVELVPIEQQDEAQNTQGESSLILTTPTGGAIQAIKRLLREVFADLTNIKQRIEDLTPRSDEEDVVIPIEGAGIEPVLRPLSEGMRRRAKAQLSGNLVWTMQAFSNKGSSFPLSAGNGGPQLEVLLQSMTPDRQHSLTARIVSEGNVFDDSLPNPGPASLQLRSLLYRAQFLGGKLRLCVAPLGGSLSNIARRLNPSAASSGLTSTAATGHDIPMVLEQGHTGVAATWIGGAQLQRESDKTMHGDQTVTRGTTQPSVTLLDNGEETEDDEPAFSISLGHFSGRPHSTQRDHHTVGQLSWHSKQHGCLSLVTSLCTNGFLRHSMSNSPALRPSDAIADGQAEESYTGKPVVRLGMCGSKTIADAFSISAWHMKSMSNLEDIDCGVRSGLQIYSLPEQGVSYGLTLSRTQRLADRKDFMAELSSHFPLANGIWLTPGLVLDKSSNSALGIRLACNTGWRL